MICGLDAGGAYILMSLLGLGVVLRRRKIVDNILAHPLSKNMDPGTRKNGEIVAFIVGGGLVATGASLFLEKCM